MSDQQGQMETMSQATARLRSAGYVENWIAVGGRLRCSSCDDTFDPNEVTVDEVIRFEGPTDPGDEAILVALAGPCEHRGQFSAAYGPSASIEDTKILAALGHA